MPSIFLNPPLERLKADGGVEPLAHGAPWLRPQLVLARELCSFELFQPPGVTGAAMVAAAGLHAVAAAPYARSGHLVQRRGRSCAIWWWNLDRVEQALATAGVSRSQCAPETLLQPPGEGWRIVQLDRGYEAQLWQAGALVASIWRRSPFDRAAWTAFVRGVAQGPDAPAQPPPATWLPSARRSSLRFSGSEPSLSALTGVAAFAGLAIAVAVSGFALGQGLRLRSLAEQAERQAQVVTRAASRKGGAAELAAKARVDAYRRFADRPNGMAALARALALVQAEGLHFSRINLEADRLTITLPYADMDRIESLAAKLERADFTEIKPMADAQDRTIQLQMRYSASPAG